MSDESKLNTLLCVEWHDIDDAVDVLPGLDYRPLWFVIDGAVHRGEGNGKRFQSDDEQWNFSDNEVTHFALRQPDWRPNPPVPSAKEADADARHERKELKDQMIQDQGLDA